MTRDELIDYLLTIAQIFALPAAALLLVALYALIIRMVR